MEVTTAGLFVGGAASRMGGIAKGLLPAPDGSGALLERLARLCRQAGLEPVLVGAGAEVRRALPELEALDDRPGGVGPIGGLAALLRRAAPGRAIALACDLPAVDGALIERLVHESPASAVLAPRDAKGRWQPFFSRWDAAALPLVEEAIQRGVRSLQPLLDEAAAPLPLDEEEWRRLRDWDTPEDVRRG